MEEREWRGSGSGRGVCGGGREGRGVAGVGKGGVWRGSRREGCGGGVEGVVSCIPTVADNKLDIFAPHPEIFPNLLYSFYLQSTF